MPMLNKSREYGEVHPPVGGACYYQDGLYFDGMGRQVAWSRKHGRGAEVGVGVLGTLEKASGKTVEEFQAQRARQRAGDVSFEEDALGFGSFVARQEMGEEEVPEEDDDFPVGPGGLKQKGPPAETLSQVMKTRPHDDLPDLKAWARGEKEYDTSLVMRAIQQYYFVQPRNLREAAMVIKDVAQLRDDEITVVDMSDPEDGGGAVLGEGQQNAGVVGGAVKQGSQGRGAGDAGAEESKASLDAKRRAEAKTEAAKLKAEERERKANPEAK